jgi:hypothetical protein
LRAIPVGEIKRAIAAELRKLGRPAFLTPELRRHLRALSKQYAAQPRPGRPGRSDADYAIVAAEYVALVESAHRSPTQAMADRYEQNAQTIGRWLHIARQRGLLTDAPKGRAGGDLTDKARRLLEGP